MKNDTLTSEIGHSIDLRLGTRLTPAQGSAYEALRQAVEANETVYLVGGLGQGKTTLLRRLQEEIGGQFIGAREMLAATEPNDPLAMEESLFKLFDDALTKNETVLIDDIDIITFSNRQNQADTRPFFFDLVFEAITQKAVSSKRRVVLSMADAALLTPRMQERGLSVVMPPFVADDYAAILAAQLPRAKADRLDAKKIFAFSSNLSIYQLRNACGLLKDGAEANAEDLIETLRTKILTSNVEVGEVTDVTFDDLKGFDDIIRQLEINVVLPMQNLERFASLDLKPKRGVLLVGPPGTGKTSVGRALAHRLLGKFFMIDGSFVTEPPALFFYKVNEVFRRAKQNSPAIIFIDDADILFRTEHVFGMNRYLLTQLDGLESATSGKITVMMTAMQIGHLPEALLRSGRVELWLRTRLPDGAARAAILAARLAEVPPELRSYDAPAIVEMTSGFNGADMKRLVEDAKVLYAFDLNSGEKAKSMMEYLTKSTMIIQDNKAHLAKAERIIAGKESEYPMDECGF